MIVDSCHSHTIADLVHWRCNKPYAHCAKIIIICELSLWDYLHRLTATPLRSCLFSLYVIYGYLYLCLIPRNTHVAVVVSRRTSKGDVSSTNTLNMSHKGWLKRRTSHLRSRGTTATPDSPKLTLTPKCSGRCKASPTSLYDIVSNFAVMYMPLDLAHQCLS